MGREISRDGSQYVREGYRRLIATALSELSIEGYEGLEIPVTQRVRSLPENHYVKVRSVATSEIDVSKDGTSREYHLMADVITRFPGDTGNPDLRDYIADQITKFARIHDEADMPDLSEASLRVYVSTVDDSIRRDDEFNSNTYFFAHVPITVRAYDTSTDDFVRPEIDLQDYVVPLGGGDGSSLRTVIINRDGQDTGTVSSDGTTLTLDLVNPGEGEGDLTADEINAAPFSFTPGWLQPRGFIAWEDAEGQGYRGVADDSIDVVVNPAGTPTGTSFPQITWDMLTGIATEGSETGYNDWIIADAGTEARFVVALRAGFPQARIVCRINIADTNTATALGNLDDNLLGGHTRVVADIIETVSISVGDELTNIINVTHGNVQVVANEDWIVCEIADVAESGAEDPTTLLSELSVGSIVEYGDQLNPNDADLSGFTSHSFTSVNTDPSVQTTEISFADEDGTLMLPGEPWENVREISTGLQSTLPIFSSTRDVGRELLVLTEDNYAIFLVSNATGVNADVTPVPNKAVGVIPSGAVTVYSVNTTREFSRDYIDFGLVDTDQVVNGFNSITFPASSDDDVDATADDRQLRIVAGQGVAVGNSSTSEFNAITISIADDSFKNFDIFSRGSDTRTVRVEAEQAEDTINFRAGTGIIITGEEIGVGDNITWNVDIPDAANTYIRTNNTADGFQGSNLTDDTTSTARESQSGGNLFSSESNIPDTPGGDYERVLLEDGRYSVVAHLGAEGDWNEQFTIWEDHFYGNATTTPPVVADTLVSLILENTSTNATFDLVAGNTSTTDDNFLIPTFDSDNNRTRLDITYYGGDTDSQNFLDFITDLDTTDVRVTAQIQFDGEYTISEANLELGGNLVVNEVDGGTAVFTDEIRLRTTGDFFAQGDAQTTDIGLSGGNFFSNYDQAITFGGGVTNNAPVGSTQFVQFRYTGGEITGDDDDRLLEIGDRISYAGIDGVFTITELRGDFRNSYTYVIEPNLSQTIPGDTVVRQVLAQEFVSSVPTTPFFVNRNMLSYSGGAVLLPQITFPDGTTQTSASTGSGGGSELEASTRTFTGLTNTESRTGSLTAIGLTVTPEQDEQINRLQRTGVTLIITTSGTAVEYVGTVAIITGSIISFTPDTGNLDVPDLTSTFSLRYPTITFDDDELSINGDLILGGRLVNNDGVEGHYRTLAIYFGTRGTRAVNQTVGEITGVRITPYNQIVGLSGTWYEYRGVRLNDARDALVASPRGLLMSNNATNPLLAGADSWNVKL